MSKNKLTKPLFALILPLLFVMSFSACGNNNRHENFDEAVKKHGSAVKAEGKTVVICCFASDENTSWNDKAEKEKVLKNLETATNWLSRQAKLYGKELEFIYGEKKEPKLLYEPHFARNMINGGENVEHVAWEYIEKKLPSIGKIKKKYAAKNVLYMMFFNAPRGNTVPSCTRHYRSGIELPYEICFIYTCFEGQEEYPATYAHEMLHTFGAPDLYTSTHPDDNRGINRAFVNFVTKNFSNDIMYSTLNPQTGSADYDSISNEITEITAYYIGWKDECKYVSEFGIGKSEHDKTEE